MNDENIVSKIGRVTGKISPGKLGEVVISIRGGTEAFLAQSFDPKKTYNLGERVIVREYAPPRIVIVTSAD